MTNQHTITPPPELVREWNQEATGTHFEPYGYSEFIAARAARWGADQELEACCEWISVCGCDFYGRELRAARRPKPPSLKEQALKALKVLPTPEGQVTLDITDLNTIRRALEALPND
jgi:hypothetical protein